MPTWRFRGLVLPGGEVGELVSGSGAVEELPGAVALAGLVDAHCHLTVARDERGPLLGGRDLAHSRLSALADVGVCLVRDVGGDPSVTLHLDGRGGQPVVQAAGRFFAPADRYFPRLHVPVAEGELLEAVGREIDDGACWIKLIADFPHVRDGQPVPGSSSEPTYRTDAVAAVIETAHRRGVRVAAHCNTGLASALVAAGVDSIEHGRALTPGDLDLLGARHGAWTPTIGASIGYDPANRDERARARSDRIRELLPYALSVGVRVLAGSDAVGSVLGEIAAMVEHGMSADDALRAAGTDALDYLGDAGHDIVTYHDDPRTNPATLNEPAAVVLRGDRVR